MFGPNWPHQGEIDILEGVHEQDANALTLHTSTGCAVGGDTSLFSGSVETQNCDVKAQGQADNAGCSIKSKDNKSYGAGLNDNGGGVYATEWTSDAISIWFFPRDSVPKDATGDNPDPSSWGTPAAKWVKDSCDIDGIFKDLSIIFDTTFCGDWAGNTWSSSSCASKAPTCNDYVRDNPDAFKNAFWSVNALKVYQQGDAPTQQNPPAESSAPVEQQPSATDAPVPSATDAPVDSPVSSEAPVDAPVSSEAPVDAPISSDAPLATSAPLDPSATGPVDNSPPIIDQSSFMPIATNAPVQQNPDGTLHIPLGPWGTNGEGGSGTNNGGEDAPGADGTVPSVAVSSAGVSPVSTPAAGAGGSGGFNWPGAAQGSGAPTLAPVPSFDAGNATGYPVLPTGTGDIAEVWETIYTTQVVTVPGVGPAPTGAGEGEGESDGQPPIATVRQTVYQTVMVTMNAGGAQGGQVTPVPGVPAARMARRDRQVRRRMVQHYRA